ncbi:NUDIX hydrolase [Rhodovulum sp. ES.010]|uniref:NUDIX hydrolase n=1 Tax=Rhodovulum sp. ES.010 TaxID=1882821 RepID=UPI0020CA075B|nr:NUDIX hydrolase [Rhodovulum sp. ES.010]
MRWGSDGTLYVLMVTAIGTRKWVMPTGWRLDSGKPWRAAELEALDAAGVVGHVGPNPIGRYAYRKTRPDGSVVVAEVDVFPMVVERLRRDWRDRNNRKRRWFHAMHAARHVEEVELAGLLRSLSIKPPRRTTLGRLFSGWL